jgi:hypothetical protein
MKHKIFPNCSHKILQLKFPVCLNTPALRVLDRYVTGANKPNQAVRVALCLQISLLQHPGMFDSLILKHQILQTTFHTATERGIGLYLQSKGKTQIMTGIPSIISPWTMRPLRLAIRKIHLFHLYKGILHSLHGMLRASSQITDT